MAKIYADLVIKGVKTLEEVPVKLRAQVATLVDSAIDAYVDMIRAGEMTIMDVPVGVREQVQAIIDGDNE